ncbi:MAG: site-specific integrase [Kiloniellaceae bacterium]
MPLTLTRRGKIYYIRGTVRGQHIYETTGTSSASEAEELRAKREAELYRASLYGPEVVVTFHRAVVSYLEHEKRSDKTKEYLARLTSHFGPDVLLRHINKEAAHNAVLALVGAGAAPATKRRTVYQPLTAVLNHAAENDWCSRPKFKQPKIPKKSPRWLTPAEYLKLERNSAPHLLPLNRFRVCVGSRTAETIYLNWREVDLAAGRVIFLPEKTKQAKTRVAQLPPAAIAALSALPHRKGPVFLRDDGQPYERKDGEGGQFKTAWATACRKAGLGDWIEAPTEDDPDRKIFKKDATPHTLRHTWASWFYASSRDPMLLRDEGGWSNLDMVERYAHLVPSDLIGDIAEIWGGSHPRIGEIVVPQADQSTMAGRENAS